MKIVILDGYAANPGDLSWEPLKQFGTLTVYPRSAANEVEERAKDADIILTNKVAFTEKVFARLPHLKYLGILATGYNIADLEAAKLHGVVVTNIPAYSTDSVVQMTFAQILNITNRIGHYAQLNREGRWSSNPDFCYWDTPLVELAGKTLGIVGLGHIGMKVAQMARVFGMDVFAMTSKNSAELPYGIQKTTFEGLLGVSDILSLHCPLTAQTNELINKQSLAKMKPGAILINTGRGPLVNEADVVEALTDGRLGAYGADVMCQEPPAADNPLFKAPNAYITPHIAWASREARQRLLGVAFDNVRAFLAGTPQNVVNP
ncbi:MAG: D-2-hydroxyacid dehydrogenase [Prevotella sp.]|nr:D-2-hydroxyacid dehydrogenase [Prevotella sp.]MDD7046277.1 D-2-hydroxyacid dehydrogenase [Prevotella sp.]MDY5546114.1 D-2-hydroxyacid dehydrogenase [Prevotella sp.]